MEQEPLEDAGGECQQQASCVSFEGTGNYSICPEFFWGLFDQFLMFALFMQVKSVLDPCDANDANSDDDKMSLGHESDQDDDFTDTEVKAKEII